MGKRTGWHRDSPVGNPSLGEASPMVREDRYQCSGMKFIVGGSLSVKGDQVAEERSPHRGGSLYRKEDHSYERRINVTRRDISRCGEDCSGDRRQWLS